MVVLNLHYHLGLTSTSSINWLYKLIPDSLFSYDVEIFNDTKYMKTPDAQVMIGPTSDMYWPIFLTFCLLSFIETFIASIQGKKPYTESGITIFEHSLAFQEFSSNGAFFWQLKVLQETNRTSVAYDVVSDPQSFKYTYWGYNK